MFLFHFTHQLQGGPMSTKNTEAFDRWIRSDFKALNTSLDELYFAQEDRNNVAGVGGELKTQLLEEGRALSPIS